MGDSPMNRRTVNRPILCVCDARPISLGINQNPVSQATSGFFVGSKEAQTHAVLGRRDYPVSYPVLRTVNLITCSAQR